MILGKYLSRVLILPLLLAGLIPSAAVMADTNSITVTPSSLIESVSPGSSTAYSVNVTSAFPLQLEVGGLGETPSGSIVSVPTASDASPFTARPWVSIDRNQLPAGASQTLTVTVNIPAGTGPGERYAAIYLHSAPGTQGNATIISGILIPVILTVNDASFVRNISGQITNLQVANAYRGKAIDVLTSFANNGNCRITNARIRVTIKDSAGTTKWDDEGPVAAPSVLPNYPRIVDSRYSVGLGVGSYSVTSTITLDTGPIYSRSLNFTVVEPPPVPGAPTLTSPGGGTAPGPVIDSLTPTFRWNAVSGADSYQLSVSRDPYSSNDIVYANDQLSGTSFQLPAGILFSGQKYLWQLTATNAAGTGPSSDLYFQSPGSATIAVTTREAASVTANGASLNGSLGSLGGSSSVAVGFEYGTSPSYGSTTSLQTMNAVGDFSSSITGLTANTVYHFRAKAIGSSTVYGSDRTFTTFPPPTTTVPPNTSSPAGPTMAPPATAARPRSYIGYFPPVIDESSLVYQDYAGPPFLMDATGKTGTEVVLRGVNNRGAVTIIAGRYLDEPQTTSAFSAGAVLGGTGRPGIKYVGVRVEGANLGTACVTVHYADDDIKGYDPGSLFLAYFNGGTWRRCSNITIDGGTVSGDVPVSRLTGTAIGLGGTSLKGAPAAGLPLIDMGGEGDTGQAVPWSLVSMVMVTVFIVGGVIVAVEMNRRKSSANGTRA